VAEHPEWDKERAEQHARWAKMASRLTYAPLAKKIVESLAPMESGSTMVDLGTGPGFLSIELHWGILAVPMGHCAAVARRV
jgi:hypothetical protein